MNLVKSFNKIYFVGIGGIGMSALARYFNHLGVEVAGYDKTATPLTKKLEKEGINIQYFDKVEQLPRGIELVVFTPAIPDDNKILMHFRANHFTIVKRAAVLGMISNKKKTIAIAGTHGKTTTSSITTWVLRFGGVDCTAFLGGIAQNFESNFVQGESDWVVVEADEYDRSFLQLSADISLITSMDADHLDIYNTKDNVEESFREFIQKSKDNGFVLLNQQLDPNFSAAEKKAIESKGIEFGSYGLHAQGFAAKNLRVEDGFFVFDLESPVENIDNIKFTLPGRHNVENATGAIAIAQQLGVAAADIKAALATFKGIKRRFDFIIRRKDCVYIDDYAHHPVELAASIQAARDLYPSRKITGIFQPHLYSRTRDFADGFAKELDQLDEVILLDIYPAREKPIPGITSSVVFDKMKNLNKKLIKKEALLENLNLKEIEVLITFGAGDIDRFIEPIKELLENAEI